AHLRNELDGWANPKLEWAGTVSSTLCCAYDCILTTPCPSRRFLCRSSWRRDFRDRADHLARVHCTRNAGPDATGNEFNGRVHGYRRPRVPRRTRVYSGARSDYRELDRKRSGASASRRDRGRHGVWRDISHMVHRYQNRRTTYGKCSSARLASSDRPDRGHCSARDYELVFPQNLLGRLDSGAYPPQKGAVRQFEWRRLLPSPRLNSAWIYFPLSRRLRSCSFSPKLQSATGRQRRAKRRAARPSSLRDGRCPHVRSAAASPISNDP